MMELTEYRIQLIMNLETSAQDFRNVCLAVSDPYAPIEQGGWNTHQLAAHTRDVDKLVYGMRARRTLEENNPQFDNFDGDAYMAEHYDSREDLRSMLDGFAANVSSLANILRGLPAQAWARESRHLIQGTGMTLQTWVERDLGHIKEHLESVKKAK
ncbi:MAG: maleylpyruvate isomerase N-terminal domain-containing protein [Chloroflexi bacterium]|nr:maleylpyruvate isomerase N-terminal domain-containing protein [Chloroflexota bacterium]